MSEAQVRFAATHYVGTQKLTLNLSGAAQKSAVTMDDLSWNGIYRRDFDKGIVLVNPGASAVQVNLGTTFKRTEAVSGDAVSSDGTVSGRVETVPVTALEIGAKGAEILLR
jgi:hypothetical protein